MKKLNYESMKDELHEMWLNSEENCTLEQYMRIYSPLFFATSASNTQNSREYKTKYHYEPISFKELTTLLNNLSMPYGNTIVELSSLDREWTWNIKDSEDMIRILDTIKYKRPNDRFIVEYVATEDVFLQIVNKLEVKRIIINDDNDSILKYVPSKGLPRFTRTSELKK